jgi:hypothetical protein
VAVLITNTVTGNVGGPAFGTVLVCLGPDAVVSQAVAYRASAPYDLIGKITDSGVTGGGPGSTVQVGTVAPVAAGFTATVDMYYFAGNRRPTFAGVSQDRTFTWNGTRFAQTGGPETFLADTATVRLSVTATELLFGPPDRDGCRTATVTVTVVNNGPADVRGVEAAIVTPTVKGLKCDPPRTQAFGSSLASIGTIRAGRSGQAQLTVVAAPDEEPEDTPDNYVGLHIGQTWYPVKTHLVVGSR